MFSLICVWINGWVNNREADDLRRYRGHYDVIVMISSVYHQAISWTNADITCQFDPRREIHILIKILNCRYMQKKIACNMPAILIETQNVNLQYHCNPSVNIFIHVADPYSHPCSIITMLCPQMYFKRMRLGKNSGYFAVDILNALFWVKRILFRSILLWFSHLFW